MRAAGKRFSSANSINWSRLLPQIVYYYYGYSRMLAKGVITPRDRINIVVPTGNFGNILAAFYALRMGLPVHRLICASNENKVLTEAITKGSYNCQRTLYQTTSPAMDILVSNNFERFLFEMANRDHVLITNWYQKLDKEGNFTIPDSVRNRWQKLLISEYATEEEADDALRETFEEHNYLADPHTAVAISVYNRYHQETNDNHKTMIVSTANPYKFPDSILIALGEKGESLVDLDERQLVDRLAAKTGQPVHKAIAGVLNKEVLHQRQVAVQDIGAGIMELLGI
jgi:threonine synthase